MASTTKAPSVRQFFAPGGALSLWHSAYEFRPGQLEMAEAVETALAQRRHLLVEAGTGTGKTLAYLIPAILSGKRVVISTGTKNLQEQLYQKDIPFLERHFGDQLKVCYMKGRANYLCWRRFLETGRYPVFEGLEEVSDYQLVKNWAGQTETGDRAEIRNLPETSLVWPKIDARSDLCTGQKCEHFDRCFITRMLRRAAESDLIIVNHHLFFADLALKDKDFGSLIPPYEAVIFDEAHEIEDVAGEFFGFGVSDAQFHDLRRDIALVARARALGSDELDRLLNAAEHAVVEFFALFEATEGRTGFRDQQRLLTKHRSKYDGVLHALEALTTWLMNLEGAPDDVDPLVRRAAEYHEKLRLWFEEPTPEFVYWVERRARGCFLQATPIDVAAILREKLFDQVSTVVLTSATLAAGGNFEFTCRRLGVPQAKTLLVPGSFDYARQALLYVPPSLPDPRDPRFPSAAAEEVLRLLELSRGRAFVLFTSHQQMNAVYNLVTHRIRFPTLLQGSSPRSILLEEFRSTPNCVLFGTSSFWQGVDVQGDQLSCVIIDKLPFAVPGDPVVSARIEMIRRRGGEPFLEYQLPQAALQLKQGFGRLIRSRRDRGVLALLDRRILTQSYGRFFFESLPAYAFTTEIDEVERFLESKMKA
jgi:ATP-dependent DNA helicase DinG